jgi:hypothetical protein
VGIDKQSHPREYVAHLGPFQECCLSRHASSAVAGVPPRGLGRRRDPGNGHNPRIRGSHLCGCWCVIRSPPFAGDLRYRDPTNGGRLALCRATFVAAATPPVPPHIVPARLGDDPRTMLTPTRTFSPRRATPQLPNAVAAVLVTAPG